MDQQHWEDPLQKCFGMLLDGRAQRTGIVQRGEEASMLLIVNGFHDLVNFTLPSLRDSTWRLLIDTNIEQIEETTFAPGDVYGVTGRSFLLFTTD